MEQHEGETVAWLSRDSFESKHYHEGKKMLGENKSCYGCGHSVTQDILEEILNDL